MKTKYLLTAILLAACTGLFAQSDNEKATAAISQSYVSEFSNHYPQAIEALTKSYDDKSYFINLRLGWLHYLSGDQKKSSIYYKEAIKIVPHSVEARMGLALPLSVMGNWDEITEIYKEILSIDPNNSVVNFRMALISFNKKDNEKATSYCMKVLDLYPFDYDTNLLLGKIQMSTGKMGLAKTTLYKALQYNPDSKEVRELLKKT